MEVKKETYENEADTITKTKKWPGSQQTWFKSQFYHYPTTPLSKFLASHL